MEFTNDSYKTLLNPSEGLIYKEKGSKFLGYAFPVSTEDEIKSHLVNLKKQHHTARHWCYAWRIGCDDPYYKVNDDGEPHNSAGQPILGQILSFELTNILVVVVRYFGGTKLGVGGLVTAYKTAAQMALENAEIIEKHIEINFRIVVSYEYLNKLMRFIKAHQISILSQKMDIDCEVKFVIRKSELEKMEQLISALYYLKSYDIT